MVSLRYLFLLLCVIYFSGTCIALVCYECIECRSELEMQKKTCRSGEICARFIANVTYRHNTKLVEAMDCVPEGLTCRSLGEFPPEGTKLKEVEVLIAKESGGLAIYDVDCGFCNSHLCNKNVKVHSPESKGSTGSILYPSLFVVSVLSVSIWL